MLMEKEGLRQRETLDYDAMDIDQQPLIQDPNAMDFDRSTADAVDTRASGTQMSVAASLQPSMIIHPYVASRVPTPLLCAHTRAFREGRARYWRNLLCIAERDLVTSLR